MAGLWVGLGNPGPQYDGTRHNVGFDFIAYLSQKYQLPLKKGMFLPAEVGRGVVNGQRWVLVRPQTMMNASGAVFPKLFKQTDTRISDLVVICDNMDLPPGQARLKMGGSCAGQKGLQSIITAVGTDAFFHLFIGVGRPPDPETVIRWVLGRPSPTEQTLIAAAVAFAAERLVQMSEKGVSWAVHEINSFRPSV